MSMLIRRMLLLGTPLLLVPLMVYHQTISPFEQPMAFFYLHIVLLFLFSLQGVAGWLLTWNIHTPLAWVSRMALLLYIIGYGAFDTLSGIAASLLIARLPTLDGAHVIWGDTVLPYLMHLGSISYMLGMSAAALTLWRRGAPRAPLIILVLSALLLDKDHGGWEGVLVFGGFFLAALWLELRFYRQGAQQAPQQATAYTEPA